LLFNLLFGHAEQIAHQLDLLEMERHIRSENNLNDKSSEFPVIISIINVIIANLIITIVSSKLLPTPIVNYCKLV